MPGLRAFGPEPSQGGLHLRGHRGSGGVERDPPGTLRTVWALWLSGVWPEGPSAVAPGVGVVIYIDDREENATKKKLNLDLMRHFTQLRVKAEMTHLQFGDAMLEINGPDGPLLVGIERKRLRDMLTCVDDGRLSGHQAIGMRQDFDVRVVMVEGLWRPHDPEGWLLEAYGGGVSWGYLKQGSRVLYAKLYRYLISLRLSGIVLDYTRDPFHTAFNIAEWWHYGQKAWDSHTSQIQLHQVPIPHLTRKPSLVDKWLYSIDGVGHKKAALAKRQFKTGLALANADESEWLKIPGVGVKTAQDIVREIWRGSR